jgi:hypothetical protein
MFLRSFGCINLLVVGGNFLQSVKQRLVLLIGIAVITDGPCLVCFSSNSPGDKIMGKLGSVFLLDASRLLTSSVSELLGSVSKIVSSSSADQSFSMSCASSEGCDGDT